ncbi:sigma-54-dependent transcriptional regulator [Chitinophagaceae bacterium MMS25-I14]
MAHILLVEDDLTFTQILEGFLKKNGHTIFSAAKIRDGITALSQNKYDLLLLDYRLPDGTAMDILQTPSFLSAHIPAIIMTSFHDIRTAVKAMRSGAFDYITKPVNPEELLMIIQDAHSRSDQTQVVPSATKQSATSFIEGTSEAAHELYSHIRLVAPTDMSVLIQGESGTGKEHIARTIHQLSRRADGPFIAVDCGALTAELAYSELFGHVKGAFTGALQDREGQFFAANGGTIFLDEVGNLSYEVQVKLLRALQERIIQPAGSNRQIKVDVRIITATNDDLLNSVGNSTFRQDLYHRINEFKIKVPALRERIADLDIFINYFIQQSAAELHKNITGVAEPVKKLFHAYDWPGNLRELRNIIKRAVLLTEKPVITLSALPQEMIQAHTGRRGTHDLKMLKAANEKEMIIKTLEEVKYNKSKAARMLHIDRKTLYYKMSQYRIEG